MHRFDVFAWLQALKQFSVRNSLGVQLLVLYVLFFGPVLTGALIFNYAARSRLEADVKAANLALAKAIALETSASLENAARTVENLAREPAVRENDVEGMRALFSHVAAARSDVNLIYRLDADGIMVYHYPEAGRSTVGVDFSFRQYFQDALQSAGPLFSRGRISPTTGKPVATAVMPVRDEQGVFRGVVATNLALEMLSETLATMVGDQPGGTVITIVDQAGQVIAYPGLLERTISPDILLNFPPVKDEGLPQTLLPDWRGWEDGVVDRVRAGATGAVVSQAPDGSEWLRSFVPVPVAGWGVIVQRPASEAFATIRRFHRLLILAVSVYVAGGLFFWLALSRRVIVPLEKLAEFSLRVGRGGGREDWRAITLTPWSRRQDQVGHLARSLTTMAEHIEQRFQELSTLLETSQAVVSTLDTSEVIEGILDAVQRLLKLERCAIVSLDERQGVFRIRASRGLPESYVQSLRIEPTDPGSTAVQALNRRGPVQVIDTEAEGVAPRLRQRARSEGFRSVLAVPLLTQHAAPAVLVLYRSEPYCYTETEIELISSFANHAAMAMENAALHGLTDARLQEQTRRLEAIVESLNDGLILEGLEGQVLYCNQRALELLGERRAGVLGRNSRDLMEHLLRTASEPERAWQDLRAALQGRGGSSIDITRIGHDGRQQDLRIHIFEVTDSRGELIGRGQFWQDITHDKDIDRMKSALISTVSHELRTPLASIKGYATTLLARDVEWDPETQREFLQTISDESDRLARFVNNLLDLSRLEGGALQMHLEPYAIDRLIVETTRREQERMGRPVRLHLEPDLPTLLLDRPRMETVLRNLLENAGKFSPPDTEVELSARRQNGFVVVRVRDRGPGVPPELHTKICDRYYRADVAPSTGKGGAGLGLAICKGFVEAHGGKIWVEDARPGAVFAFSLPLNRTNST
ncbi:MAG: GAF domain-containing protein [Caldilineae bacterium]|nr:MAG: GAF domain-containing protein [Caldilineae bacterium]